MVKTQVNLEIQKLLQIYRNADIILTGHSLGGALAVMAAADLQSIFGKVKQLYTFGQPRVGNAAFANYMTNFIPNTFRVIDYGDQVPHVPQSILGFKHSGYEVWYYERGMSQYKICPS
jgi:predicted lipase